MTAASSISPKFKKSVAVWPDLLRREEYDPTLGEQLVQALHLLVAQSLAQVDGPHHSTDLAQRPARPRADAVRSPSPSLLTARAVDPEDVPRLRGRRHLPPVNRVTTMIRSTVYGYCRPQKELNGWPPMPMPPGRGHQHLSEH